MLFPNTNTVKFGPNFTVTDLGGGKTGITMAAASTWPWPFHEVQVVGVSGVPGTPQNFALANPITSMDLTSFVYVEGVKMLYGVGNDYVFPDPNTIRFLNIATRVILQAGMEIEIFHD